MSPDFRTNGNTSARAPEWQRHAASGFTDWRLQIDGLVEAPAAFSLAELRAMPARNQITRHDCVEGWSAIGKWTGVPLAEVLGRVRLRPEARFIVLHCADDFRGTPYYESIDLVDASHPQTILAYGMNDADLPVGHGAPIRLRVERQLGYKHAKFVMRIEAAASLAAIGRGRGGFWEDMGDYDWYAGI
jgi:DMSO/TMAO reductase YedYZ molybdopterin-dependent catalytic subunit